MITVGTLEAKTHLSALLERAAAGEEILVTKHGKPFAKIVPAQIKQKLSREATLLAFADLRNRQSLDGVSWKDLRDEGKK